MSIPLFNLIQNTVLQIFQCCLVDGLSLSLRRSSSTFLVPELGNLLTQLSYFVLHSQELLNRLTIKPISISIGDIISIFELLGHSLPGVRVARCCLSHTNHVILEVVNRVLVCADLVLKIAMLAIECINLRLDLLIGVLELCVELADLALEVLVRRIDPVQQLIRLLFPVNLLNRRLSIMQSLTELFRPDQLELLVDPLLRPADSLDILH